MKQIRIAPRAADDLGGIHVYIKREGGEDHATRAIQQILDRTEQLAVHPKLGITREHKGRQWRVLLEGRYLIYYRETDDGIEVSRVIHGRRDQPQALGLEGTDK